MIDHSQATAQLTRIRDGLASTAAFHNDWIYGIHETLVEAVRSRVIWFDAAAQIAAIGKENRQRALADFVVSLLFNSELLHFDDA